MGWEIDHRLEPFGQSSTMGDPSAGGARRIHDRSFSERVVAAVAVPRVGAAFFVVAAIAFAVLALLAAFDEGALLAIDEPIQRWVVDHRAAWLDDVMRAVTFLGSRYAVGTFVLAVAIWTYRAGRCRVTLLVLVAAFILNPVVEFTFKELIIERTRPQLPSIGFGRAPRSRAGTCSWPSGSTRCCRSWWHSRSDGTGSSSQPRSPEAS